MLSGLAFVVRPMPYIHPRRRVGNGYERDHRKSKSTVRQAASRESQDKTINKTRQTHHKTNHKT